jgi:hypothetical protein
MTFVGFAGLLIGLAAVYIADLKGSRRRISVFASLFVLHALASVAYYFYAEASGSDAHFYYYDSLNFYGYTSGLGTPAILNFVQVLKERLGGTFFDYFMVFQASGFWGIIFIYKCLQEIFDEVGSYQPTWTYLLLFLPGLHFWTGAIGKDAPAFLGIAMSVWAAMHLKQRAFAMGLGLALMMVVRPHVAMLALIALAFAALLDRKTSLLLKSLLLAVVASGAVVVAMSVETTTRVDVSSAESVSQYMEARGSLDESSGADRAIMEGSIAVKLFSLWFRPFFIDAENAMGYIASLENTVLMIMFAILAWHLRIARGAFARVLYIRFASVLFVALTILLAAVSYNIGLGLRQKMMAMPCFIVILASLLAIREAQRSSQLPRGDPSVDYSETMLPAVYTRNV